MKPPLYCIVLAKGQSLSSYVSVRHPRPAFPLHRQRLSSVTNLPPSKEASIPRGPPMFLARTATSLVPDGIRNVYVMKQRKNFVSWSTSSKQKLIAMHVDQKKLEVLSRMRRIFMSFLLTFVEIGGKL